MTIISIREFPDYAQQAILYFQKHWANEDSKMVYEDCIMSCLHSGSPLPQWYLLFDEDKIIGGAGLITNDFISRMDLYPWLCALYIEKDYRGHSYGSFLMERIKTDARKFGYSNLYLCTDHIAFYERYDFKYIGDGHHPWGHKSRIYEIGL
ncbi:GNAT family N-acetyltransferase [Clostridium sp. E02]|uniref:GNAT family N-acetyltransferase n=1 Tax=Clostridium sp. E02 TaxID=2487134 RepID=UPI000F5301EA|nr:GNAT family N-acetyltransferase [Clostridium sp. E02]